MYIICILFWLEFLRSWESWSRPGTRRKYIEVRFLDACEILLASSFVTNNKHEQTTTNKKTNESRDMWEDVLVILFHVFFLFQCRSIIHVGEDFGCVFTGLSNVVRVFMREFSCVVVCRCLLLLKRRVIFVESQCI